MGGRDAWWLLRANPNRYRSDVDLPLLQFVDHVAEVSPQSGDTSAMQSRAEDR